MRDNNMETLDLLALIKNTYDLSVALKDRLTNIKSDNKREHIGITALTETLEQNLYNISIEVEDLLNLH